MAGIHGNSMNSTEIKSLGKNHVELSCNFVEINQTLMSLVQQLSEGISLALLMPQSLVMWQPKVTFILNQTSM